MRYLLYSKNSDIKSIPYNFGQKMVTLIAKYFEKLISDFFIESYLLLLKDTCDHTNEFPLKIVEVLCPLREVTLKIPTLKHHFFI